MNGVCKPEPIPCPVQQVASSLTCIGRLFAMVKLGMGGKALYVLVRAVSVRPNMEPDVKEETAEEEKRDRERRARSLQGKGQPRVGRVRNLSWLEFQVTRRGGLWNWLVDTGTETAADRNVTRGVAGLSPLVPQFLFSSPFGPSIRKPYLEMHGTGQPCACYCSATNRIPSIPHPCPKTREPLQT